MRVRSREGEGESGRKGEWVKLQETIPYRGIGITVYRRQTIEMNMRVKRRTGDKKMAGSRE